MTASDPLRHVAQWARPPLSDEEQRELAARVQAGDQSGRWALVRSVARLAIKLVLRRQGQPHEDLVHHLLVHLVRRAHVYDPERASFATWAYPRLRSELTRAIQRGATVKIPHAAWREHPGAASRASRCRELDAPLAEDGDPLHEALPDESAACPEQETAAAETRMAVQSAVASLPRADRPLAQARLEGKTWQEIGEGLKVSRQAAQQRGARAEERLRRRLADVR